MDFVTNKDKEELIKSAQQYEFLMYNSMISEVEKNIKMIGEGKNLDEEFFSFNPKNYELNIKKISNINLFAVQSTDYWEDEDGPMHNYHYSEIPKLDTILNDFNILNDVKIIDRFEKYKEILSNLVIKYDLNSLEVVNNLYLLWKNDIQFDYNHHEHKLYSLPICIPNDNMSRKFNKWYQSMDYDDKITSFLDKIALDVIYSLEMDLKREKKCKIDKKMLSKHSIILDVDKGFPPTFPSFNSRIKGFIKYNRSIDFNELSQDMNQRSEQYIKIISDLTNSSADIHYEIKDIKSMIVEIEKKLISNNLNKELLDHEVNRKRM